MTAHTASYTAFEGSNRLVSGSLDQVALAVEGAREREADGMVLVFDDDTGAQLDLGPQGRLEPQGHLEPQGPAEHARLQPTSPDARRGPRGPGRPRLGVVAREVTLLPRHWDWLNRQPGGASVTLRRLVDAARTASSGTERTRRARQAADRFMTAIAGNLPGYEEASRALYAGRRARFEAETAAWPRDVRDHARRLAEAGLDADEPVDADDLSPAPSMR